MPVTLTDETADRLNVLLDWASLYLYETIEDARVCVKKYGNDQEFIDTYELLYNTAQEVMVTIDNARKTT